MKTELYEVLDKQQVIEYRKIHKQFFLKELYKKYITLENDIINFGKDNNLDIINKSQLLYHYVCDMKTLPLCKSCGNVIPIFGVNRKWEYNKYCSKKCTHKDTEMLIRRGNTRKGLNICSSDIQRGLIDDALKTDISTVVEKDILSYISNRSLNDLKVHFIYKHPKWYNFVIKKYSEDFSEGIYLMIHNTKKCKCENCNEILPFLSIQKGYGKCKNFNCIQIEHKKNKAAKLSESCEFLSKEDTIKGIKGWVDKVTSHSFYTSIFNLDLRLYKSIIYHTRNIQRKNIKFNERIYLLHNNLDSIPICSYCNDKIVRFNTFDKGYSECCSVNCSAKVNVERNRKNAIISIRDKSFDIWEDRMQNRTEKMLTDKSHYISTGEIDFKCSICEFVYTREVAFDVRCPRCSKISISKPEIEISDMLKSFTTFDIITSSKRIIPPLELDIYIPEKWVAIEFDGLYWHSSEHKENKYHINKTKMCEKLGIQLIHIFENEWNTSKELVKSIILSKLGIYKNKIFARNCYVKDIDNNTKNMFLIEHHIQGKDNSKYKIGLFDKKTDELISVMTFGSRKITGSKPTLELMRYCCKQNTCVVGGASKLFSYFIRSYNPQKIISYANRRYSNGGLYNKLGFDLLRISPPNFWYFTSRIRDRLLHRVGFQKHMLAKRLGSNFDPNKTAEENMKNAGYLKIYDCGNYVFEWNSNTSNKNL